MSQAATQGRLDLAHYEPGPAALGTGCGLHQRFGRSGVCGRSGQRLMHLHCSFRLAIGAASVVSERARSAFGEPARGGRYDKVPGAGRRTLG